MVGHTSKELLAEAGYSNSFSATNHFGVFTGRPVQPEVLAPVASDWKEIDVDLKIVQHHPTEFSTQLNQPDRAY
jgi:hypothetical protein